MSFINECLAAYDREISDRVKKNGWLKIFLLGYKKW